MLVCLLKLVPNFFQSSQECFYKKAFFQKPFIFILKQNQELSSLNICHLECLMIEVLMPVLLLFLFLEVKDRFG